MPLVGARWMTNPAQAEDEGGSIWQAVLGLGSHGKMVMGKWLALVAPSHSWHTCHRYIGPKFKCLQKVKM